MPHSFVFHRLSHWLVPSRTYAAVLPKAVRTTSDGQALSSEMPPTHHLYRHLGGLFLFLSMLHEGMFNEDGDDAMQTASHNTVL